MMVTAEVIFDRLEFQRWMTSIKSWNLDCIIVKDLSRLASERIGAMS